MNVLILYSTLTNNTEDAARALFESLQQKAGHVYTIKNVRDTAIDELSHYEAIIFGCSTWDDGPSPDTIDFSERLKGANPDLSTIHFSLFGLGDSSYPLFCNSTYEMQSELKEYKATVYEDVFTIDGYPLDEHIEGLTQWVEKFFAS